MSFLYNFGQSQEDERTEAAALYLTSTDSVISIASAGDMPLSLAAMGAQHVTAIDIDPAQIALTALKLAAVQTLSREEAMGFLGYLPMEAAERQALFVTVRPALSARDLVFWDAASSEIGKGAIWVGRFERYITWLRRIVVPLLGRRGVESLFECKTTTEQEKVFDRFIDKFYLKGIFRIAFNKKAYSGRGMDPRSLAQRDSSVPLGDQYFGWFRSFCTANLAHDNYFLQLSLLGRLTDASAGPAYLSEAGYQTLRSGTVTVDLHLGDLVQFLEDAKPGSFNKAHLSNICDWMNQESFEKVIRLLAAKSVPGGRIVWRFLHVDRALSDELQSQVTVERSYGKMLRECDRYPFYTVIPAQITE